MIAVSALVGQAEAGQSAFHRGLVDTDPAVDAIVTRASQSALDYYRRQNHLNTPADVRAVYDPRTGMIRIDLRGGLLPESGGAELEDLQGFISNGALDALRPIFPATGTKFFYNGRAFEEQYPAEAAKPDLPDVWNSLPNSSSSLRERDEDIRSRPRYANHLDARALIHLHTNAGNPAASGARAYVAEGRPETSDWRAACFVT